MFVPDTTSLTRIEYENIVSNDNNLQVAGVGKYYVVDLFLRYVLLSMVMRIFMGLVLLFML